MWILSVLIPRPETEMIIEKLLDHIPLSQKNRNGFELGVGSGVVSITLLLERPEFHMLGIDISPEAITMAQKNGSYHGVMDRWKIENEDF